jgi:hypothetical protein
MFKVPNDGGTVDAVLAVNSRPNTAAEFLHYVSPLDVAGPPCSNLSLLEITSRVHQQQRALQGPVG